MEILMWTLTKFYVFHSVILSSLLNYLLNLKSFIIELNLLKSHNSISAGYILCCSLTVFAVVDKKVLKISFFPPEKKRKVNKCHPLSAILLTLQNSVTLNSSFKAILVIAGRGCVFHGLELSPFDNRVNRLVVTIIRKGVYLLPLYCTIYIWMFLLFTQTNCTCI